MCAQRGCVFLECTSSHFVRFLFVRPCHDVPGHRVYHIHIQAVDRQQPRIEQAFRKYFHRATDKQQSTKNNKNEDDDEIEILVGPPNVLRYFLCRALQLPPETYGRYSLGNCSITYVAIAANGVVTCRTVGDVGHLTNAKDENKERFLW